MLTDVARSAASEIAEIELAEIAEIERFVDAVFSFVVAVASIVEVAVDSIALK